MRIPTRLGWLVVSFVLLTGTVIAGDWPGFRGDGSGSANDELPAQLTKESIRWKVKLDGVGTSSPVILGDRIYLTSYSGYGSGITKGFGGGGKGGFKGGAKGDFKGGFGKEGPAPGDLSKLMFHVQCLDAANGKEIWKTDVKPSQPEQPFTGFIREHGYASSTLSTDGERLYAFFGKSGVFAFDLKGTQLWQTNVGTGVDGWGSASSPLATKDSVVVNAAVESNSLVGLDKKTGQEIWRVKGITKNWTSPLLVKSKDGTEEVVLSWPGKVVAYNPAKGTENWHCKGIGSGSGKEYTISSPIAKDGIVYVVGGGGPGTPPTAFAVKAGGKGDVTESHVVWKKSLGSNIASPVLVGENLCWVNGKVTCLKSSDGSTVYDERLYDARGEYVSAVASGGRVYALTRNDGLFVLGGSATFEKLSHLPLEDDASIFNASPAISNSRLYLRSNAYLYCLGK